MFSQKKPYTAVTVTIERLTSESYEEDDLSGIPDLVEVIKLQATGPIEAARAIRKKLKYGSVHRQLRALTLLDGLIQNAGARFQHAFADEPLLERLRVCGTSELSDPDVRKKCSELFRNWTQYKNTPGLERIARLYKELPQRKQVVTQERSKAVKESENPFDADEDEEKSAEPVGGPSHSASPAHAALPSSSSTVQAVTQTQPTGLVNSFSYLSSQSDKDKAKKKKEKEKAKKGRKPFNLEAEKGVMKTTIADASIAAIDLMNTLQSINREQERISENAVALHRFEAAKLLRRKVLRYIYLVNSEEYLGSLLHANDELVTALMTFEQLDRSIDADSDSDDDLAEQAHRYRMIAEKGKEPGSPTSATMPDVGDLSIDIEKPGSPPPARKPPPRPLAPPRPPATSKPQMWSSSRRPPPVASTDDSDGGDSYEDDENDPFADRNEVGTPRLEKSAPHWK